MRNKYVGLLIIGIAVLLFLIVMSFNNALEEIVDTTCTHGESCSMNITLKNQKIVSYSLMGLLVLVGLFITFFIKDESKIIVERKEVNQLSKESKLSDEEKKKKLDNLDEEERAIMNIVLNENGSVYQSEIIKQTKMTKVKITRIMDRLEGKGLIERKRRGMTNIVILK